MACLTALITSSVSCFCFFFFKQKTAYEMRISDWSSDVCSSDLAFVAPLQLDIGEDESGRGLGGQRDRLVASRRHADHLVAEILDDLDVVHRDDRVILYDQDLSGRLAPDMFPRLVQQEIGRASCRERVCQYV